MNRGVPKEHDIIATYAFLEKRFGSVSIEDVTELLNSMGFRSPRGKKLSRMAVYRTMVETDMGRELLARSNKRWGHPDRRDNVRSARRRRKTEDPN